MDLNKYDYQTKASKPVVMTVTDPTQGGDGAKPLKDEQTGEVITISLIGREAKEVQDFEYGLRTERLNRSFKIKRGRHNADVDLNINAAQTERDTVAVLAKCTVDWTGIVVDGESLPCTEDNANKLYERFSWLRDQVEDFVNDRSNFLGN